jgi:N-acetylglucosaminyldiphosphoundecaprenol N-acetyl-beta-D-mannosaminyltransferase
MAPLSSLSLHHLLGFPVALGQASSLLQQVLLASAAGQQVHVVTVNPEMLMRGQNDPAFRQALTEAELPLCDGAGVVWALKRAGLSQPRLPGIEFAEALLAEAEQAQWPVALLGAKPTTMAALLPELALRFPRLHVVFHHHGFFSSPQQEELVGQALFESKPRLVLAALGVPKQELWLRQHRNALPEGCIMVGVGGSFDVWAKQLKRAPLWMRQLPLEWAWRFWQEPWRLQRSMPPLLRFVAQVLV